MTTRRLQGTVYCEMCESMVWKDAAHSCHDAKALRAVRDAERAVITKAVALEFAFRDPADPFGYTVDEKQDALLEAVRALRAHRDAGRGE
ncbi:hypothetical protein [Gemmatimonas sp.]|uniref:hypothetical protein n=1 Tax=Gemmatimonas sp. TaxID=1962908 RepID=UPI003341CC5D